MRNTVVVAGITLTRAQVVQAMKDLDAPELPALSIVRQKPNPACSEAEKRGVVLPPGDAAQGALKSFFRQSFACEYPVVVIYENGSINGFPSTEDLLRSHVKLS